jgi:hypothetical protein
VRDITAPRGKGPPSSLIRDEMPRSSPVGKEPPQLPGSFSGTGIGIRLTGHDLPDDAL